MDQVLQLRILGTVSHLIHLVIRRTYRLKRLKSQQLIAVCGNWGRVSVWTQVCFQNSILVGLKATWLSHSVETKQKPSPLREFNYFCSFPSTRFGNEIHINARRTWLSQLSCCWG